MFIHTLERGKNKFLMNDSKFIRVDWHCCHVISITGICSEIIRKKTDNTTQLVRKCPAFYPQRAVRYCIYAVGMILVSIVTQQNKPA